MKRKVLSLFAVLVLGLGAFSCSSYVQDVQPLQSVINDSQLDDPSQLLFLIQGVQREFTRCYSQTVVLAGGLSDELVFDARVPNATFPQFQELETGLVQLDNASASNNWAVMGSARFVSDNLITRIGRMQFPAGSDAVKKNGLYNAYLYGGIIRSMYAAYYGFTERQGGGVINGGPFVPSAAMTDSALTYLNLALQNAATDVQRRQINTMIAKVNLVDKRYSPARTAAQSGLKQGDAALTSLYEDATIPSRWYFDAGRGRAQLIPDARYAAYLKADPAEGVATPGVVAGGAFTTSTTDLELANIANTRRIALLGPFTTSGFTYHVQSKFPNQASPSPIVTWQENELMLAELGLRVGNDAAGALVNVNNVRKFYKLAERTETTLDSVYIERDKTLFGMGTRLSDQRRFDKWHLGASTWQYLPIGQPERNANPNLKGN